MTGLSLSLQFAATWRWPTGWTTAASELVVLAGYMQLLTPAFLERFDPIVNVHPSLLPAFPGRCGRSSVPSRRGSPRRA